MIWLLPLLRNLHPIIQDFYWSPQEWPSEWFCRAMAKGIDGNDSWMPGRDPWRALILEELSEKASALFRMTRSSPVVVGSLLRSVHIVVHDGVYCTRDALALMRELARLTSSWAFRPASSREIHPDLTRIMGQNGHASLFLSTWNAYTKLKTNERFDLLFYFSNAYYVSMLKKSSLSNTKIFQKYSFKETCIFKCSSYLYG